MPEETNEFEERATLTQRRQMSGAAKLSRAKLEPIGVDDGTTKDGSAGKIVVWVVAIVTIAVAAYFGFKSFISKPTTTTKTTPTPTQTVSPTPTLEEQIMTGGVSTNDKALPLTKADSAYNTATQTVGKAGSSDYSIDDVSIQKYVGFTRFIFTINPPDSASAEAFPAIVATYSTVANTISIKLNQIGLNTSAFSQKGSAAINTTAISKLTHSEINLETSDETYVIELKSKANYVMFTGAQQVIIDVKDTNALVTPTTAVSATVATTPTTTIKTTITPTIKPTTTTVVPTAVAGATSTEFSATAQSISSTLTGNSFNFIDGFRWGDGIKSTVTGETYAGMFTFEKQMSSTTVPNVDATIEGTKVTVNIRNNVTANRATQVTTFTNSKYAEKLESTITDHVLSYVFTLRKESQYRIVFNTEKKVMHIQFK